jgi:predicted MPP superfamily phosphohydrolase
MQRPFDQAVENNEDRFRAGAWLIGWGITALLGLGLLLYAWWIEPDWIEVKEHDRKHVQVQEPIRVALLSDRHLNEIGHREHRIAQALDFVISMEKSTALTSLLTKRSFTR